MDEEYDPRNARGDDPDTSHWGTAGIKRSDYDLLENFMRRYDRDGPPGWTTGEVKDALPLGHAAIWRRMSDLDRDGLVECVPGPDGKPVTRVYPGTGRAQRAHRIVRDRPIDWQALWEMADK